MWGQRTKEDTVLMLTGQYALGLTILLISGNGTAKEHPVESCGHLFHRDLLSFSDFQEKRHDQNSLKCLLNITLYLERT